MPTSLSFPKIGSGIQYTVYAIGNGRVLKVQRRLSERIALLKEWDVEKKHSAQSIRRRAHKVEESTAYCVKRIQALLRRHDELADLLGNPRFLANLSYEQDELQPIGKYFEAHTPKQNRAVLEAYIYSILETWTYGFTDTVFNFSINSGVNSSDDVVLLDFGEATFHKQSAARRIRDRRWLRSWSYQSLSAPQMRNWYAESMEKYLTQKTLDKLWRKRLT